MDCFSVSRVRLERTSDVSCAAIGLVARPAMFVSRDVSRAPCAAAIGLVALFHERGHAARTCRTCDVSRARPCGDVRRASVVFIRR